MADKTKGGERDGDERDEEERDEEERDEEERAKDEKDLDEDEDDEDDEDEKARAEEPPKKTVAKAKPAEVAAKPSAATPASGNARSNAIVVGIVALAAGAAIGWFGNDARAKAKLKVESAAPAGSGSAGPCNTWEQKICADTGGERGASCQQAKVATELLTPSACEAALASLPATLAKLKAARASCDTLVDKLCKDLPPGSQACEMVKARTPSFPPDRCKGMLEQYDQVLGQLKMMDSKSPPMGHPGGPPGGMPHAAPGAMPHAAPPGAVPPPGAKPPGAPPGAPPTPHAAPPPAKP